MPLAREAAESIDSEILGISGPTSSYLVEVAPECREMFQSLTDLLDPKLHLHVLEVEPVRT